MRHIYIRGLMAFIWLAAAIYSAVSGNLEMAGLYLLMFLAFSVSAYIVWKNRTGGRGGK